MTGMAIDSRHIWIGISRPQQEVYAFVADPANLPSWRRGSATVEMVNGEWVASSPMGQIVLKFAPPNDFGVADHQVTLADGQTFYNPLRVLPDENSSEVVFTLRRLAGVTDEEFERDAATITADLARLKALLES